MKSLFVRLSQLVLVILLPVSAGACPPQSGCGEDRVRNIIYMIGDGMGVAQVTHLIIENGLEPVQMERADAVGLVRTFSANNRVTDSAAAGTALATGRKANNGVLGIGPDGTILESIMSFAKFYGMATGFVVTVQVTHATPAAFYANVDDRSKYYEIAQQLVDSDIDVFIGGGLNDFTDREDELDLVKALRDKGYLVATDFAELKDVHSGKVAALLTQEGSFPYLTQGRDADYLPGATAKALEILKNNSPEGFFLMVEGSMIDYAGHGNDAGSLLGEMMDFDRAVGVAFDFADANPGTLVVVLADHETGGLTLPSGDSDFTASESGVDYRFSTDSHTATLIPLFAYGPQAKRLSGVWDNTQVPLIIAKILGF